MAILRSAAASPFARKCSIAIITLGLEDQIALEPADTSDPSDTLRQQNPLGKIPTLVLEDDQTLYDSRVIIAYLDQLAGGNKLFPADPLQRIGVMKLEALADGIMDAALLQVYEQRFRAPHERSQSWVDRQSERVRQGLTYVQATKPPASGVPSAGTIAVACALGYLDLRFEGAWRQSHPQLVDWLNSFRAANPAYDATRASP